MSKLPHGGVDRDVAQIPFHRVHHGRGDRGVVVAGPWRGGEPGRGLNPTPGREIGKPVKTQSKNPIESKSLNERTTVEIRRSAISRGKHAARLYMDSAAASAQNSENGGKRARKARTRHRRAWRTVASSSESDMMSDCKHRSAHTDTSKKSVARGVRVCRKVRSWKNRDKWSKSSCSQVHLHRRLRRRGPLGDRVALREERARGGVAEPKQPDEVDHQPDARYGHQPVGLHLRRR